MNFGDYLSEALIRKGLSQRSFSLLVKYRQQALNRIIRNERVPPLDRLEAWADALHGHIDRDLFLELAYLAHTPPTIQRALAEARAELKRYNLSL